MATETTVAIFQNACGECHDAIEAENWASAIKWYAKAEAINAGLEEEVSDRGQSAKRRTDLAGLYQAIQIAKQYASQATDRSRRLIKTRTRHA